jgi:type IV pilus assembly protein PilW
MTGTSLVDVLVGLVVALLAIVVVYRAFAALDTLRRGAADASDAQVAAMFALDTVVTQIGNAGAGWFAAAPWLESCPASADVATTLRPVAVLIADGGAADRPDAIVLRQAVAPVGAIGAALAAAAPLGTAFDIEASSGFDVGNRIVAVSRTGACALAEVTSRTSPAPGVLRVAHTAVATDFPASSVLLDLGPAGSASALRFDVSSGTLRSTDIANGDAPVPLAANIVNLKFQYGIDSDGDGALDTWVPAGTSGPWSAPALLAAPRTTLARIAAVRIGLIVRSDARDPQLRSRYDWVLFDCERDDKSTCPGRLTGTIGATGAGAYRYRTVETIVPVPNVAWNAHG